MNDTCKTWLDNLFDEKIEEVTPLRNDASFRHYFRVRYQKRSYVLMVAPPEKEDCHRFLAITKQLIDAGIHAPAIHAVDLHNGYVLLEDFGDCLYLDCLKQDTADRLYHQAIDVLIKIQQIPCAQLDLFDARLLLSEMNLFVDWYCSKHLRHDLTEKQNKLMEEFFTTLIDAAIQQPQVFVHRDYHSRNLMSIDAPDESQQLGVLDYQDAVRGPVTYDLVSLLRDCYVDWPEKKVNDWIDYYLGHIASRHWQFPRKTFIRWFDLMGIQRHLKAIGIFARLAHRDNKNTYLDSIPRTLNYVHNSLSKYREFTAVAKLFRDIPSTRP